MLGTPGPGVDCGPMGVDCRPNQSDEGLKRGATMMGEIEEACGRIEHLVESGYLPDSLKRDLELLLRAVKRGSAGDADDGPASIMKRSALIELADLVGTTEQTIGKIEKSLEHSSFSAIADVLGIDRRLLDRPALNAMKP